MSNDFQSKVMDRSHTRPVVVIVTGANCAPCKTTKPALHEVAKHHSLAIYEIEAGPSTMPLVSELKVRAVPTIITYIGGREISRFTGGKTADELRVALGKVGAFQQPLEGL